ncbi:MAG TPA: orotate phosphoribosyltransferase [Bryobacteraceae bacterium]|jgi:orotate phosphoribosyltransferase|nr:orotate phosphoribosyltransferase [Bryobacteraceae bacterium]
MALEQDRQLLAGILRTYSIRRGGEFKLASGRISNVYCDARVTTCRAEAIGPIGRLFLDIVRRRGWSPQAVGGMTLGADPIVIAVARESMDQGRPVNAFLVRKEAKGHGLKKQIEGLSEEPPLDVVIVDDVCTTGDSTIKAIGAAREAGLNVLGAICLVDREEGAREGIEGGLGCPFDRVFTIGEL